MLALEKKDEIDPIAHRKQGHLAGTRRPLNHDVHTLRARRLKETGIPMAFPGLHLPLRSSRQTQAADGTAAFNTGLALDVCQQRLAQPHTPPFAIC